MKFIKLLQLYRNNGVFPMAVTEGIGKYGKTQTIKAAAENVCEIAALAAKVWTSHTVEELVKGFATAINDPDCAVFLMSDCDKAVGFARCGLRHDYVEGTTGSPVGYLEETLNISKKV